MSNVIKIKNSDKSGGEPLANSLSHGELAINYRDGKIFFKDHLGGIGYFEGVTSDVIIPPTSVKTEPSDSEILSWMNV